MAVNTHAQFWQVEGTRLVDPTGHTAIWRGIGLGGWMLQEGYMLQIPGPQYKIEANITDLIGAARKAEFYEAWYANHMREADVAAMARWGYNLIRLPMHYQLFTPAIEAEPQAGEITFREKGFLMIDQLIEWCKTHHIYLILDLHAAPGGQGKNADINDYDPTKPSLWESVDNQQKTIALWQKLAERYKDEPTIAAYDLINEPNWSFTGGDLHPNGCDDQDNSLLWELQKDITAAIRAIDTNHIIVVEGNCWGNNYRGLPELWDNQLVLSFHKYWNGNTVQDIQHILDMRHERQVPVWLGESGENGNTWFTDCIELLEQHHIGWTWWPFKKLGFNNPVQVVKPEGYQAIQDYWRNKGPRPHPDTAYTILMQLAENLKFENNIQHPDVVDAMLRQPSSSETLPFGKFLLQANQTSIIPATDYDLGRNGSAYYDHSASNTTGSPGGLQWNEGRTYRNDGVDIQTSQDTSPLANGFQVSWTETGEWMQYTFTVADTDHYQLSLRYAARVGSAIGWELDGTPLMNSLPLAATGGEQIWQTVPLGTFVLPTGTHQLKLKIVEGGMHLGYLQWQAQ